MCKVNTGFISGFRWQMPVVQIIGGGEEKLINLVITKL